MKTSWMPEDIIAADDSLDTINHMACQQGWGDGLPVVPPTIERVVRMMATVDLAPEDIVAEIFPKRGIATVEKLAANAVMAGCMPSYFPVVIAAAEAMAAPEFNLFRINCTTNSVGVMLIINGPVRHEIGVNCGYGLFGPGWRANATIGRAARLIQLNIGGSVPGSVSKSTHGQPGRFSMCIGENEEVSPWEPMHVERGLQREDNAVTVFPAMGTTNVSDLWHTDAKDILGNMLSLVDCSATHTLRYRSGQILMVMNPDHAKLMGDAGLTKQDVRQLMHEVTSHIDVSRFVPDVQEKFRDEGLVDNGTMTLAPDASFFDVMVAGGEGGLHATMVPGFSHCMPVTKKVIKRS
ncbi:MAG: hypothetical protein ABIH46_00065 [Chloroflexota bacterium]